MNINDFKKYFLMLKGKTDNFKEFNLNLFQKTPQIISIFRILLGLTQRDLERKLKLKGRVISNYESKTYKTLSLGRAKLFTNFFEKEFKNNNLSNLSFDRAIKKFIEVKESMYNHKKAALIGLQKLKLTEQEKKILNNLKKLGQNFKVKQHFNVETKKGTVNVDFVIYLGSKLIAVVEATNFSHSKSRKFSTNFKNRSFLTDYKFIKIKESFPRVRTVYVIDTEDDIILKNRINETIKNETIAIDNVFINEKEDKLQQLIRTIVR